MKLKEVPGRVFLDTCIVNFMLDHGEQIHDGAPIVGNVRVVKDVEALRDIYTTGQRAMWQFAISPYTYFEVLHTADTYRREQLQMWFSELWLYWRERICENDDLPSFTEAEDLRVRLMSSGILDILPDFSDRLLLCDAICYRCDLFCTRDWSTILKHRDVIKPLGIDIVSPSEWWSRIEPFAGLWA